MNGNLRYKGPNREVDEKYSRIQRGMRLSPKFEHEGTDKIFVRTYQDGTSAEYYEISGPYSHFGQPEVDRKLTIMQLQLGDFPGYKPDFELLQQLMLRAGDMLAFEQHFNRRTYATTDTKSESRVRAVILAWDSYGSRDTSKGTLAGLELHGGQGPDFFIISASVGYNMEGFTQVIDAHEPRVNLGHTEHMMDRYPYCEFQKTRSSLPVEMKIFSFAPPYRGDMPVRTEVWMPTYIDQTRLSEMMRGDDWEKLHGEPAIVISEVNR